MLRFTGSNNNNPFVEEKIRNLNNILYSRWRSIKCRLKSGKEPRVTFSWYHNNIQLSPSEHYKIRSKRRSGSVLNIRGLAETAGLYTCTARSVAGEDFVNTTLYVHGNVHSVCEAGYCLNQGTCSVVTVTRGVQQPACSCPLGYAGLRCELKTVLSSASVTSIIIAIGAVIIVILIIALIIVNVKFKRFEAILMHTAKERDRNTEMLSQKLLSQKMVAQNGTKPVIKPDLHDRLELTRIHQSQQQLQQMRGAGFNKSASSPIMVTGKFNHILFVINCTIGRMFDIISVICSLNWIN